MPAPLIWAAWVAATAGIAYGASILAPLLEDPDPYQFPDEAALHPEDAPVYAQRLVNPLWAPTAYLQGVDCLKTAYKVRLLDGEIDTFTEYTNISEEVKAAADESSLSYSVHVNEDGHAVLLLKAMSLPQENDKHESGPESTIKDTWGRDAQIPALDMLAQALLNDPNIKSIETIGFAQGSEGVYHLAEKYKIIGTNISNTGTDYTSEHLDRYVVWLDTPGDIHWINATGEHMPGYQIDLGEVVKLSATPVQTSWVEKIQSLAFKFSEAQAPEGYEDKSLKWFSDEVCDNPTMPQVFTPPGAKT